MYVTNAGLSGARYGFEADAAPSPILAITSTKRKAKMKRFLETYRL